MITTYILWLFVMGSGSARLDTYATRDLCNATGRQVVEKLGQSVGSTYICISHQQPAHHRKSGWVRLY